jgi:hypothetical protein
LPVLDGGSVVPADVGEIHAQLSVGTESISSLVWSLTPPSGVAGTIDAALSGTVPVSASGAVEWTLGGLPAATGYELTLTATTNDGVFGCASSTTFDIAPGKTSRASLTLACEPVALKATTGNVSLNVHTVVTAACTGITSVSASPVGDALLCQSSDGVTWGQTMQLVATAIDSLGNTSNEFISYSWTTSPVIGSFDDPTSSTPVFTCLSGVNGITAEMAVTTSAPGAATCGEGAVLAFSVSCLTDGCLAPAVWCDCHVCTDLASDPENCGACGVACPNGSACVEGTCPASDAGSETD